MRKLGAATFRFRTMTAVLAACLGTLGTVSVVAAQAPPSATLTVTSGQAGVLKANGAQYAPAASGLTLGVGDQVGTVGSSSALVTFFEGTELELGRDTTIILRDIRSSGNEVHVTIEDVVGATTSRLKAFVNPNSSYQVQNPGGTVVAVGRGTRIYYNQFNKNQIVGLFECNAKPSAAPAAQPQAGRPQECYLLVYGTRYDGPGIFLIREGVVTQQSNTDQPPDTEGIPEVPPPGGGGDSDDNPGSQGDDGGGYSGFVPDPTVSTIQHLATRLGGELNPLGATGTLLTLAMVGWTIFGSYPGRRR